MRVQVKKWGNSRGVIFPAMLLDDLDLNIGDEIEITSVEGGLVLKPAQRRQTLEEMLEGFTPAHFIMNDEDREWDNMKPAGDETL